MDDYTEVIEHEAHLMQQQPLHAGLFTRLLKVTDDESDEWRILAEGSELELSATGALMIASMIHSYAPTFIDSGDLDEERLDADGARAILYERLVNATDGLIDSALDKLDQDLGEGAANYLEAMRNETALVRSMVIQGGLDFPPTPIDHLRLRERVLDQQGGEADEKELFAGNLVLTLGLHQAISEELDFRMEARQFLEGTGESAG